MGPAELKKYLEEYNKKGKSQPADDLPFKESLWLHVKFSLFALCSVFKNFGIVYVIINYLMPFVQDKYSLVNYKEDGLFSNINPVGDLVS